MVKPLNLDTLMLLLTSEPVTTLREPGAPEGNLRMMWPDYLGVVMCSIFSSFDKNVH